MAGGRSASNSPVRAERRVRSRSPPKRFRSRSPRNRGGRESRGKECRVFVSNLPFETKWMELKDAMKKEGKVVHVEILTNSDGRPKGMGVVEYATAEEAQNAITELHGTEFQGRKLFMREDKMSDSNYEDLLKQSRVKPRSQDGNRNMGGSYQRGAAQSSRDSFVGGGGGGGRGGGGDAGGDIAGLQQLVQLLGNNRGNSNATLDGLASLLAGGNTMRNQSSSSSALSALAGLGALGGGLGNLLTGNLGSSLSSLGGSSAPLPNQDNYRGSGREPSRRESFDSNRQNRGGGRAATPGCQVFVRNLPFSVRWQDLKDRFKQAGRVTRADVMTKDDGRSKGVGTVAFENPEDANRAVSLFDGYRLDGREIEVRIDRK